MAEVHVVGFLWIWTGAISASKKLSDINAILSWHPDRPQVPDKVTRAMSPGLAHPGQWAITRRDTQLSAIIKVCAQFVRAPSDQQKALLGDPFAFRDFTIGVPAQSGDAAKLGMLHVIFPETFEQIVSTQHKEWIAKRFAEHAGDDTDLDRRLINIREHLSQAYGQGFSYYEVESDPLINLWWKNPRGPTFLRWLEDVWRTFDHDERERDYKLVIAKALSAARDAMLTGSSDWPDLLATALAQRINNLIAWQVRDSFLRWMNDHTSDAEQALRILWGPTHGDRTSARLDAFAESLKVAGISQSGAALNLGSILLMAEDETDSPPIKVRTLRKLWQLGGWSQEPEGSTVGQLHRRAVAYFDEVLRDTHKWSKPMRDRLDAQGALWTLATLDEAPASWTEEHWTKFREFQDGSMPEQDDGPLPADAAAELLIDLPTVDHIETVAKDLYVDRTFLDEITTLLDDKGQVIFYGPPGTGKTYLARRLARALARSPMMIPSVTAWSSFTRQPPTRTSSRVCVRN